MGLFDGTILERPVICERCGLDAKVCKCPPLVETAPDTPPEKQSLRIRLEKRKRGKLVTVISGFHCQPEQLQQTLSYLKSQCGAGGTIDTSNAPNEHSSKTENSKQNIELQGDHTARVGALLKSKGYRVQGSP